MTVSALEWINDRAEVPRTQHLQSTCAYEEFQLRGTYSANTDHGQPTLGPGLDVFLCVSYEISVHWTGPQNIEVACCNFHVRR